MKGPDGPGSGPGQALPVQAFRNQAAFDKWLAAHGDAPGVWLKIARKDSGVAKVHA